MSIRHCVAMRVHEFNKTPNMATYLGAKNRTPKESGEFLLVSLCGESHPESLFQRVFLESPSRSLRSLPERLSLSPSNTMRKSMCLCSTDSVVTSVPHHRHTGKFNHEQPSVLNTLASAK